MEALVESWWLFALRGAAAVGFGVLALLGGADDMFSLVLLFGSYAFLDGMFFLGMALHGAQRGAPWGPFFLGSIASVLAGILVFLCPETSVRAVFLLIAVWAMATGAAAMVAAIRVRREITGEWLLALSGAWSVLFGVLFALFPGPVTMDRVGWLAVYALLFGVLLAAFGLRLHAFRGHLEPPAWSHGIGSRAALDQR
jgi:uncharacterized membrane protein HdeD (DUF308 family)